MDTLMLMLMIMQLAVMVYGGVRSTIPIRTLTAPKFRHSQRGSLSSARHSVEGVIDKARHLRWIKAGAPKTAYTTSQRTPIGPFI